MAQYEHLPIYKKAIELAVYLQGVVKNFSRYNKYSIGTELRDASRKTILLIIRANSSTDKPAALADLVEAGEMLKSLIVFAKEIKAFADFKSFQHAATLAVVLCKQSEGWLKSSRRSRNHQPRLFGRADERAQEHCAPSPPSAE